MALSNTELAFLLSHLNKPGVETYFEWGIGETTTKICDSFQGSVVSIDNSLEWVEKTSATANATLTYIDTGPILQWGNPVDDKSSLVWPNYYNEIRKHHPIDVVLVDGRWRVSCVMAAARWHPNAFVFLHDFVEERPWYKSVLNFMDVFGQVERLVCLKRRSGVTDFQLETMIAEYSLDYR